jgi:hypothetical protein
MARLLVIGAALGGAAMYLLDPQQGKRRRALLRDRAASAQSDLRHFVEEGKRDLANRASDIGTRARAVFVQRRAEDREIAERVRTKMGRYALHPDSIEVDVHGGYLTLSGPILSHEHADLIDAVRNVDGVKDVVDRLGVYETAEGISETQGERSRDDWAPGTRMLAGTAGAALALLALRGGARGVLYAAAGALLLMRSATNQPLTRAISASRESVAQPQPETEPVLAE